MPDNTAAKKVAEMFGVKNYNVVYNNLITTDGNKSIIELTLHDVTVTAGNSSSEQQKVTSSLALALFEIMAETERAKYDQFKAGIKNKDREFNNTYDKSDLAMASLLRKEIDTFFIQIKNNSDFTVFDPRINDSTQILIRNYIDSKIPSDRERTNSVTSFEMNNVKGTNEPVIVYTVESRTSDQVVLYTIGISKETRQIVHINVR